MIEIERKFLVSNNDFIALAVAKNRIVQGYLNSNPERTVRVRIKGDKGFLTIKGKGNESGTTRLEWETEIPLIEAEKLLSICENGVIDKIRYEIPSGKHTYEVDVFAEQNNGLIIAEIELNDENESFEKPSWLAQEVTGNNKYYNAYLNNNPFGSW
ncbi:CYTH domain-containing protein [Flavobacterium psychrophilum]|jgi:CYTH domain-containing protein|uniref:CYTH domain-containing protein n=1 Tax=Flavobacterium psychrophilum TaxID=96345 RepID=A0A1Z5HKD9_FLAPS|nr:CYTH domain-containing protein [Flavobacterium psychrophilum]EKT3958001.1 CYTH domain-containing protein [Flavobacterium psychrophilum]EKT3964315.1 CYTH domain-containing protein [Flavobacterium psychrophilum]EKT3965725.1 CYTH domain-containing protein [Flavobacterium psychrophilum]EKT4501711.1 CYTH domain-containing protein [Flavobacterium psychrophilum]EKT4510210.1 CYTH domain-containing protein [Flavobacterium psychrophilum]